MKYSAKQCTYRVHWSPVTLLNSNQHFIVSKKCRRPWWVEACIVNIAHGCETTSRHTFYELLAFLFHVILAPRTTKLHHRSLMAVNLGRFD